MVICFNKVNFNKIIKNWDQPSFLMPIRKIISDKNNNIAKKEQIR